MVMRRAHETKLFRLTVLAATVVAALTAALAASVAVAAPRLVGGSGSAAVRSQTDGRWVSWATERAVVARDTRTGRQFTSAVPAGCRLINAASPGILLDCMDPATGSRALRISDNDGSNLRTVQTPPAGVVASVLGRYWIASTIVMDRGNGLFINPRTGEQRRASTGADPNSTDLRKPRYALVTSQATALRVAVDGRIRTVSACRFGCRTVTLNGQRVAWVEAGKLRILQLTNNRRWTVQLPRKFMVRSIVATSHEVWVNARKDSESTTTRYHTRIR